MSALAWLALGIGYTVLWSLVVLIVSGAIALAWTCLPRPRVMWWRP